MHELVFLQLAAPTGLQFTFTSCLDPAPLRLMDSRSCAFSDKLKDLEQAKTRSEANAGS